MEKFRSGNIIKDKYGNIKIFIEYFTNNDGKRLNGYHLIVKDVVGYLQLKLRNTLKTVNARLTIG